MKKIYWILFAFGLLVAIAYYMIKPTTQKSLPIINPTEIEPELVDSLLQDVGRGHKIGKFNLIDQDGKPITEKIIQNHVFVAEYFFSTCGSICPIMNVQMQRIQSVYKNEDQFKLLSFTVDPETDSPQQLKTYAENHQYNPGQWHFITGKRDSLYRLARTSFFVLKPAEVINQGDAGSDFIHTNNFVLVDKVQRIRGYYDGTNAKEVDKLIKDIQRLLDEK